MAKKTNKTNIDVSKNGDLMPLPKEPDALCNARLRYKGGYCSKGAGWGTDHEGTGRCKDHGGAANVGRPKKSYAASEFAPGDVLKKFEAIVEADPFSLTNVDNEITALRAIFYEYLKKCAEENKLPHPEDLNKYVSTFHKLVDLKNKLETKAQPHTVKTNIFILYVNQINTIIRKHIDDPKILNAIADDLEALSLPEADNERS
jgi:hypothetical protein